MSPTLMSETNATQDTVESSYDALGLPIDCTLVIERIDSRRKFPVRLLGACGKKSIMVSAPKSKDTEVVLGNGETLHVRFLNGKSVGAFETHVLYRCYQPMSYYHLAYPGRVELVDVRNAERVATQLQATVDSEFVMVGDWPKQVLLDNVSETGLRFVSDEFLALVGHELEFSFNVPVDGQDCALHLRGIVRNIEHMDDSEQSRSYEVGIQFVNVPESQRLILARYVFANKQGGQS